MKLPSPKRARAAERALRVLLAAVLISIGFTPFAKASTTTYSYTGNPFTIFNGADSCPPECHLSGSFTIATLPGGLTNATITPPIFQFTDGFATLNQSSPYGSFGEVSFQVSTDVTGNLSAWNIILEAPTVAEMQTYFGPGTPFDETWNAPLFANNAAVDYPAGKTGTFSAAIATVPEPSSLLLIGTGLLGVIFRRRPARSRG